jgi:hypothetical protein
MSEVTRLRAEFLRLLTVNTGRDRRRKNYNQAIFDPSGYAIWSSTDLDMVMEKFDRAAAAVSRPTTMCGSLGGATTLGPQQVTVRPSPNCDSPEVQS